MKQLIYAYHLGQTYALLEDTEKAICYFNIALNLNNLKNEYKVFNL